MDSMKWTKCVFDDIHVTINCDDGCGGENGEQHYIEIR